jgi:hypothetical protein
MAIAIYDDPNVEYDDADVSFDGSVTVIGIQMQLRLPLRTRVILLDTRQRTMGKKLNQGTVVLEARELTLKNKRPQGIIVKRTQRI